MQQLWKIYRQRSITWLGIAPNNWLTMSHKKGRSRTAWGSRTILNRRESRMLYQKTRNPRLIFPRNFRTNCEQPITKGHPLTMFLRILPPQDTPHDCSHLHKMAFKTHPDRENIPWYCIPARTCKCTDSSDMHHNSGKTILYLSAPSVWHHTCTRIIYHHHWGINQTWGQYP